MKIFFVILFCLSINLVYSQKTNTIFKFSPFALIDDANFPTIQFGVENKLKNKWSVFNELSYKYAGSTQENNDTTFTESSGFKYKCEVRKYLKTTDMRGLYYGYNFQYIFNKYNTQVSYSPLNNRNTFTGDSFAVMKNVFIPNIIIGTQMLDFKHLILDFYCGVGLRFRNVKTINKEYDKSLHNLRTSVDVTILSLRNNIDTQEGLKTVFNFTTGLRIGYRF